ncbi:Calcium-binding and coiled-coil domain-containing protein 2 [Saguinus oedipus]|uniref:Calcium-binding and coiled-coil domain-containing protein 2 n=1 Tax=Saguinus oedipus TaxID=9490 RepID=A0ABQ9VR46_SAGOE|nr:Calcium-binding and coiled-coil domain-containing protein 2 [Saguinus oedipus]
MEKTVEDPPTSAVLLDHCHFSQVIFNSMEKFYIPGGDVTCHYTFTQHFIPRRKDWIGIFRVGWKTTSKQHEVQFKAYYLPKDNEYYQFCYVDQDGVVQGASIPFQFRPENEEDILVVTTQGEVEEIQQHNKELCKENQELKDSCVSLQKQNSDMQAELQKKQEELLLIWSINILTGTEKKEMEKLVQGDQDKTEQPEHLKKENDHLFLSLTEKRKDQKKLEQTVEEMKQNETTAMKKQQELMDENLDLSRRLSENKMIYEGGAGQNPGLVYGNPYSGIQESSSQSPRSIKKCPICKAADICDHILEQQQMQALCLNCPICGKTFPTKEKQIFEDHVFCHSL